MMSIGGEGVTECMQQLQLQLLLQLTSCPRRWTVENQASVSLVWPDSPRGSQAAALRGRLYTPQRTPRICNIRDIQLLLLLLLYLFNGLFSRIIWVSRYQKGKTSLDLNETRDEANSSASDSLDSHDKRHFTNVLLTNYLHSAAEPGTKTNIKILWTEETATAQHLWPSGVLSCWPDGLELSPGFYPGSNESTDSLGVYLKHTCSSDTSAFSTTGVLTIMHYINPRTHSLNRSLTIMTDWRVFPLRWKPMRAANVNNKILV